MSVFKEITTITIKLLNKYENIVNCTLRYNGMAKEKMPLLVFCHGFKGFKDWGCFPYLLESLSEADIFTVGFNFSHNGVGLTVTDEKEFTRLEMFEKNTISKELDDLDCVIKYLINNTGLYNYDIDKLILAGHSRGGAVATIKTSEEERIKKLITLASVDRLNYFSERKLQEWKEKGYDEFENTRTKQMMKMSYEYIEDLEKNKDRFDLIKAMEKINVPTLIIHGTEDLTVPKKAAENLYNAGDKNHTYLELYQSSHTFGCEHPFKKTTTALENIIYRMIHFITEK
jgi:pimeloyl-ACP methyl ester carboxylesterase